MKRIVYRERHYLGDFKAVDYTRSVVLNNTWQSGGLLYGYRDRYNVMCIATEDIISIEEI